MVNIYVPEVPTRNDYRITRAFPRLIISFKMQLTGICLAWKVNAADDGLSRSGTITIFNPNDPQGTGAAPSSLVVSSAPPISITIVLPTSTTSDYESSTRTSATTSLPTSLQGSAPISVSITQTSTPTNGACPLVGRDMVGVLLVLVFTVLLFHAPV